MGPTQAVPERVSGANVCLAIILGLGWYVHRILCPTHCRSVVKVSTAINLNWINQQACRLSQNLYIITNILYQIIFRN